VLTTVARTCYRRRRLVVAAWLVLLVLAVVTGPRLAGAFADGAAGGDDLIAREFPGRDGADSALVVPDVGVNRPALDAFLTELASVPGVVAVDGLQVAPDGKVAVAGFTLAEGAADHPADAAAEIVTRVQALRAAGVDAQLSGGWFGEGSMPSSELLGLLAAVVVLLVAFGSVLAMGVPITTALVGVGITMAGVGVVARFFQTPDFTTEVAAMIGIGVGIDYALFVVTRYREALGRRGEPEAAVLEAADTAGRAVLFAGGTVMISILGMFLMGLPFLYGLAVGTSLSVAVAVVAALTLLPALLGFLGRNIDRLHVGRRRTSTGPTVWERWARLVQRRPLPVALAGLGVLLLAAVPVLGMRLGFADAGNDPAGTTTREAYDLIAQGFGPGANGPIVVAAQTDTPERAGAFTGFLREAAADAGVVQVGDPVTSPSGAAQLVVVTPGTGPQDRATEQLVHRLDHQLSGAMGPTGAATVLTGQTAAGIDFTDRVASRLPLFIGAVLALSFLLLLVVFRSVLVPVKAVVMNLLSIGAAYGVMVAVFQWGWLGDLLGIAPAPVEPWAPMMLFAIVFGLSMDYEVFLLSAIKESHDAGNSNAEAVVRGLSSTARVITAAATIMVLVFGSFVLSDLRALKLIGLGLAVAVAVDATIVRIVLVPATMELLGDANWWLPRWLDRRLPHVHVEAGKHLPAPAPVPAEVGASA
jgi:putative drug exporter of the RND superfamily